MISKPAYSRLNASSYHFSVPRFSSWARLLQHFCLGVLWPFIAFSCSFPRIPRLFLLLFCCNSAWATFACYILFFVLVQSYCRACTSLFRAEHLLISHGQSFNFANWPSWSPERSGSWGLFVNGRMEENGHYRVKSCYLPDKEFRYAMHVCICLTIYEDCDISYFSEVLTISSMPAWCMPPKQSLGPLRVDWVLR